MYYGTVGALLKLIILTTRVISLSTLRASDLFGVSPRFNVLWLSSKFNSVFCFVFPYLDLTHIQPSTNAESANKLYIRCIHTTAKVCARCDYAIICHHRKIIQWILNNL